jgi:hypothetical protein
LTSDIDEKIWTIQELELMEPFDVVCLQCKLIFGSKSGAPDHSKTHNKFYRYDQKNEVRLREIKEKETIITDNDQIKLKEKLDTLKKESDKYSTKIFLAIKVGLSSAIQMKISEETHPFTILFNGNITNREIILNSFKKIPDNVYLNSFTPKSFVSHSARHSTKDLKDIDLLPKINNNVLITPNVDSIFLGNKPTVNDSITMLDVVLEGNGYESHSAVHGVRGYVEKCNFVWLGTINQINKRIFDAIVRMNNKPLFFKLDDKELEMSSMDEMLNSLNEDQNLLDNEIISSLDELWGVISELFSNKKKRIRWDSNKDNNKIRQVIVNLSMFLRDFRAYLPTQNTAESTSGGTNYNFDTPIKEDFDRLSKTLYNLARGHAIIYGRCYLTTDDLEIIFHVVMSSIPKDRLKLFEVLFSNKGAADTIQIEKCLLVSKTTALKEMEKLRILGIVDNYKVDGKSKPTSSIELKNEYGWILEDKFKIYLKEIILIHTVDNSKLSNIINNKDNLEKQTMKVCDNYNYTYYNNDNKTISTYSKF